MEDTALQVSDYQMYLKREEYCPTTIRCYSKYVQEYLKWAHKCGLDQIKPTEKSIQGYIQTSEKVFEGNSSFKNIRAALHLYHRHITGKQISNVSKQASNRLIEDELDEYDTYSEKVADLSTNTRVAHHRYLKRFLYYAFTKHEFSPSSITVQAVQNFLASELKHLSAASKKVVVGIIRSYIRFLKFKGITPEPGLSLLPLSTPVWSMSGVPKTFEADEINRILVSYDRSTASGTRDYAIALFLTELGLRASEVANITLDDFNWHEGKVLIKKTKSKRERVLPLTTKVGEAIVVYLKNVRPQTTERTVFVRFSHKRGQAMGREQIRGTIRRAYSRAGISSSITGTHILRHSKAKNMYENGSSLKIIADVLGHESIDTAVIYTKVGRSFLHCVACPWPEVHHE